MRWVPRLLLMISSASFSCAASSLPFWSIVVADEVDGCVGAAAGRREGADGSLAKFAGAEVERQQTVGGGVGEEDFFSHGRESASDGGDEAGFADAAGEREDGEDRGAGFFLANGAGSGCGLLAGLLEDSLEGEPAGGDALAGVLQGVGHGGLNEATAGRRWAWA